MFSTLLTNVV